MSFRLGRNRERCWAIRKWGGLYRLVAAQPAHLSRLEALAQLVLTSH